MTGKTFLWAVWLGVAAPAAASAASFSVPAIKDPEENRNSEFRGAPQSQDFHNLIQHLESCIASRDVLPKNIPGIDLYLVHLEDRLRRGYESHYLDILGNADEAREQLRLAYNDLLAAEPMFSETRKTIKEVSQKLSSLLETNQNSVRLLGSVADSARATAGAMTTSPPGSPGALVQVESLYSITPLEPEIKALQGKLRQAVKDFQKAKGLVRRAEQASPAIIEMAKSAGELDAGAVGHLNIRKTREEPGEFHSELNSREIILHADHWLQEAVKGGKEVAAMMQTQLDPKQDGIAKALDFALKADVKTQNGKTLEGQSGQRINFNHAVRLNDLILHGWEIAADQRKPWWVGRAIMAKSEAQTDAWKMANAHREAETSAKDAQAILQEGLGTIADLDKLLGTSEERPQALAKRTSNLPQWMLVRSKATRPQEVQPQSETVKTPMVLGVQQQDVLGGFDSGRQ